MKLWNTLLFVCLSVPLWGQGYRYDSNAFTSANNVPAGSQSTMFTVPFAKITVCAYPDDGGQPCTNTVPIYQDPALTVPAVNPITADVHGRFGFWKAAGFYTFSVVDQNGTFLGTYLISLGGAGGETTLALTTNGTSGPSTLTGDPAAGYHLNVPNYQANFQQQVIPPVDGQYVVVYPTSVVASNLQRATAVTSPGSIGAKLQFLIGCGGLAECSATFTWSGFTLPSYVDPASVTAVYAFGIYSGGEITLSRPSYSPPTNSDSFDGSVGFGTPLHQSTQLITLTGAQISGSTQQWDFERTLIVPIGMVPSANIAAVGYIVYYSGPAPPANTSIVVDPPLFFNGSTLDLGIDQLGINYLQPLMVATLPNAASFSGDIFQVTDGTSSSDCTTGGGSTVNLCRSNGTIWSVYSSGGGGAVSSVANSDGTLTISPTTGSVVASLALGHANTWTGKQTQPAPLFSDLTGLTQCLHVNTSGQVSGTGSDCGAGGGGIGGSGTTGYYPLWTGTTTQGNGNLDDGVTTAGTITSSEPIAVGGTGHYIDFPERTAPANPSAGSDRVYTDSTTHQVTCLTSAGGSCMPGGGSAVSNPVTCTVNSTTDICITLAPYYGSSDGATTTTTSATFAVGTSGSVASCSTFSANQGIYIAGAGAAGANYIGTVVSCSGTTLTVTPATSTSVASGAVVQHDESAAIQAAITALSSTGGNIYFPDGTYLINGALQDTSGANAVIIMPVSTISNSTATRLVGFNQPNSLAGTAHGALLKTSITSGAVFGGFCHTSCSNLSFTYAGLQAENITAQAPAGGSEAFFDMRWVATAWFYHVSVGGVGSAASGSSGILFPYAGNDVRLSSTDLYVSNFGTCVQTGEHTTILELGMSNCIKGLVPTSRPSTPYAGNIQHVVHAWCQLCTYELAAGPNVATIKVDSLDIESASTNGIYDPTNLMYGEVGFNVQAAAGAVTPTNPAVNGATNLCIRNIQFPNGTAYGGACPATGGVSSVFTRTGAVTAASGDYNFAQIGAGTATAKATFPGGDLFNAGINAQTGTSYTVVSGDENKVVTFSNASAIAVTLPQATTTGFGAGAVFDLVNIGVGTATITPTTSTINGASSLVLATGQSARLVSDGANYAAELGAGAGGVTGTSPIVVTGSNISCPTCSTGGGSNVTINGGSSLGTANLNDTTPAPGTGNTNVKWQVSGNNVSAYCAGCEVNITGQLTGTNCTISAGQCVASGSSTTIGLSSIPSGFRAIRILLTAQTSTTGAQCVYLQFNADTGAHYSEQSLSGNVSSVGAALLQSNATPSVGCISGTTNTNTPGTVMALTDLYGSTSFTKNTMVQSGRWDSAGFGNAGTQINYQNWNSTAAITSMVFGLTGGNFQSGSSISIYGIP